MGDTYFMMSELVNLILDVRTKALYSSALALVSDGSGVSALDIAPAPVGVAEVEAETRPAFRRVL